MPGYLETLKESVSRGLMGGAALGLWFGIVYLLNPAAALARYEVTLWQGVVVSVAGGGGAGLVAGSLAPLSRHVVGAVLVGALALLPFAVLHRWATSGHLPSGAEDWTFIAVLAGALGGLSGAVIFAASRATDGDRGSR
jgi:hypothetical protein